MTGGRVSVMVLAAALAGCAQPSVTVGDYGLPPDYSPPPEPPPFVEPVGIRPIPPIPAALHGCWFKPQSDDPEEPGGGPMRVVIDDRTITVHADDQLEVASARYVETVTATSIEGLFASPNGDDYRTVATSLILGPHHSLHLPAGMLRIAEGDAGSWGLTRCESGN